MVEKADKRQLVVIRQTPYGNSLARAALDAALTAAAFEQAVSLLFLGEGVLQLLPAQDSTVINTRNIARLIASLPLYDIETLHVDADALNRYSIAAQDLPQNLKLLDAADIHQLIAEHDHVLSF